MFVGFDNDGEARYDSKEAAIERAKQIAQFKGYAGTDIVIQRAHVPLWFAHLVRETWLEWLAYEAYHDNDQG